MRAAVLAMILTSIAATFQSRPADHPQESSTKTMPVTWQGGDCLIDRLICFRTSDWSEWASLWKAMFGQSRSLPQLSFETSEIVGVIVPRSDARIPIAFGLQYVEDHDRLTLTLEQDFQRYMTGPFTGSQYAFAVVPKSTKQIDVRVEPAKAGGLPAKDLAALSHLPASLEALPLIGDKIDALPNMPLHLGGESGCGRIPEEFVEVFLAEKAVAKQQDSEFELLHFMIRAKTAVLSNKSVQTGGSLHDGFGQWNDYPIALAGRQVTVHVEISERDRTIKIGDTSFSLDSGNYVFVEVAPDGRLDATQLPIVKSRSALREDVCEDARRVFLKSLNAKEDGQHHGAASRPS